MYTHFHRRHSRKLPCMIHNMNLPPAPRIIAMPVLQDVVAQTTRFVLVEALLCFVYATHCFCRLDQKYGTRPTNIGVGRNVVIILSTKGIDIVPSFHLWLKQVAAERRNSRGRTRGKGVPAYRRKLSDQPCSDSRNNMV